MQSDQVRMFSIYTEWLFLYKDIILEFRLWQSNLIELGNHFRYSASTKKDELRILQFTTGCYIESTWIVIIISTVDES